MLVEIRMNERRTGYINVSAIWYAEEADTYCWIKSIGKRDAMIPLSEWKRIKPLLVMPAPAAKTHVVAAVRGVERQPDAAGHVGVTAGDVEQILWNEEITSENPIWQEIIASDPHTDETPVVDEEKFEFEDDENAGGPPPETDLSRLQKLMLEGDYVFLDTETTGLNGDAEICQIAIVDAKGKTLLDTLVKPTRLIPNSHIHGITDEMVANAPTWADVRPQVLEALRGKSVIVYNATYDRKMMHQSDRAVGLSSVDYKVDTAGWHCAMLAYAEYNGDWNEYRGSWAWQKLVVAAGNINYVLPAGLSPHTALADCLMARAVSRKMAGLKF